jgi:hypothetical protein
MYLHMKLQEEGKHFILKTIVSWINSEYDMQQNGEQSELKRNLYIHYFIFTLIYQFNHHYGKRPAQFHAEQMPLLEEINCTVYFIS